jgi:hypothetical protein
MQPDEFSLDWKTVLGAFAIAFLIPCIGGPLVTWTLWMQLREMRSGSIPADRVWLRWMLFAVFAVWTAAFYVVAAYVIMFKGDKRV